MVNDRFCDWRINDTWGVKGLKEPDRTSFEIAKSYYYDSSTMKEQHMLQGIGGGYATVEDPPIERPESQRSIAIMAKWIALAHQRKVKKRTPKQYKPPKDLSDLKTRLANGETHFPNTDFSHWDLRGAPLMGCDLSGSTFRRTNLENANFYLANLSGCDFFAAEHLNAAIFKKANLSYCDLTGASDFPFDANRTTGILVPIDHNHAWLKLKSKYNYISLVTSLVLSAMFFIPILVSILFWGMIAKFQTNIDQVETSESTTFLAQYACRPETCTEESLFMASVLTLPSTLNLGITTVLLLFYNILRLFMTSRMSEWRSAERDSYTPSVKSIETLLSLNKMTVALGWVAFFSALWLAITLTGIKVDVPNHLI